MCAWRPSRGVSSDGGLSQAEVTSRENWTLSAQKLALSLLSLLFTQEELATGICTPQGGGTASKDRVLLDQTKIDGIKCKFLCYYKELIDNFRLKQLQCTHTYMHLCNT